MTVTLNTLQKTMGVHVRDALRVDATVLAFNSLVDAENWIFFGKIKDLQKKLTVPKIEVRPITQSEENWSLDNLKQVLIPMIVHFWIDEDTMSAYDPYELVDAIAAVGRSLEDTENIHDIFISEGSVIDELTDGEKTLQHGTITISINWRQS